MRIQIGGWLRVTDINGGETIQLLDAGNEVQNTRFPNPDGSPKIDYVFTIEVNGQQKRLSMNTTSRKNLFYAFGDDTVEWVDKKAKIQISQTKQGAKFIELIPIIPEKQV